MSTETNTPRKYRKQPVVIEAMQFGPTPTDAHALTSWMSQNGYVGLVGNALDPSSLRYPGVAENFDVIPGKGWYIDPADGSLMIRTLEGDMRVTLDDYVILGVQGEFYPCKPDIFAATYSLAHRAPCVDGEVCGEAAHCPPSATPPEGATVPVLTLGQRIRLAAAAPDMPSITKSYLELIATDADTLTRVGEKLVASQARAAAEAQQTKDPIAADKYDVAAALAEHLDGALVEGLGRVLVGADSENDADLVLETSGPAFRLRVTRLRGEA